MIESMLREAMQFSPKTADFWPRCRVPGSHVPLVAAALFSVLLCGASAQTSAAKAVGSVKSISGNSLVLTADNGSDVTVTLAESARIVRAEPGQSDLKSAAPISVADIEIGDRVLARGQPGEGNTVIASSAIVMKKTDLAARQQQEREAWRQGVGGIVKSVDANARTVTIANALAASGKPIVIHVAADAVIRRYAPDSVKFDDAKPGTLDQIRPGDQLRARGTKNTDGTEFTAQALVSGTFRDIAGTVVSTDAANNAITVMDLTTKKPVAVQVSADSQLRKLPQRVAQMIAMRLKGGANRMDSGENAMGGQQGPPSGASGGNRNNGRQGSHGSWQGAGQAPTGGAEGGPGGNWRRGGGPPDFQQMLSRMPAVSIAELQKGDAVLLVATEGSSAAGPTAITLLAGVEPILSAAPAGTSASTILSPWNLSAPAGAGGDSSTQ
jgi:hypothetical protein